MAVGISQHLPFGGASWPGGRAGCRSHRPALTSLSSRPHPGSGELSDGSRWPGPHPCVSCPGGQEPHCTNGALVDVRPAYTAILHRLCWCSLPAFTDSQVVDLVFFVPRLAREQRQSPSVFRIPGCEMGQAVGCQRATLCAELFTYIQLSSVINKMKVFA